MQTGKFFLALLMIACSFAFVLLDDNKTVHDFKVKDISGNEVSLSRYKGKTLLIVNVASKCGYTPQYADLQELYEKYADQDFVVLGFPANNFMGQEPGDDAKINRFCTQKFGVTFPMFSKISVKGRDTAPLYKYLTKKSANGVLDAPVRWNFQKFLISPEGKVVKSFSPKTKVTDKKVVAAIDKLLK